MHSVNGSPADLCFLCSFYSSAQEPSMIPQWSWKAYRDLNQSLKAILDLVLIWLSKLILVLSSFYTLCSSQIKHLKFDRGPTLMAPRHSLWQTHFWNRLPSVLAEILLILKRFNPNAVSSMKPSLIFPSSELSLHFVSLFFFFPRESHLFIECT